MTLRNIELLSSSMSFSITSRQFPAFLECYKMGKPSKYKFALNSIFTILALARFSLAWLSFWYQTAKLIQLFQVNFQKLDNFHGKT